MPKTSLIPSLTQESYFRKHGQCPVALELGSKAMDMSLLHAHGLPSLLRWPTDPPRAHSDSHPLSKRDPPHSCRVKPNTSSSLCSNTNNLRNQ